MFVLTVLKTTAPRPYHDMRANRSIVEKFVLSQGFEILKKYTYKAGWELQIFLPSNERVALLEDLLYYNFSPEIEDESMGLFLGGV